MQQPQLRGYWNYCGLNMFMLSQVWKKGLVKYLSEFDLSLSELMILRLVASTPDIKIKDIALYTGEGHSSVSKQLSSIEKKGLIYRKLSPELKQVKTFRLSHEGRVILEKTDNILSRHEESFLGHLPRATRQGVNMTIEQILDRQL